MQAGNGFGRSFVETPAEEWEAHAAALRLGVIAKNGMERTVFPVCVRECDACLFTPGRIVSPRRMKDVLDTTVQRDTHFVCHKASMKGYNVACRGWYDRFTSNVSRMAGRLGLVMFVLTESLPDRGFMLTVDDDDE